MDHPCPVRWGVEHGLANALIDPRWCFSTFREMLARLPDEVSDADADRADLELYRSDRLAIYYTPFDWVNTAAVVTLVGITPGRRQATDALRAARDALAAGLPADEVLRRADAVGSFAGPMRANLVRMLDGIGLAAALGIASCASLFAEHAELANHTSAISYPVFIDGANYGGSAPPIETTPILRAFVEHALAANLAMTPASLVIPLGKAARRAIELLLLAGRLDARRCLLDFPHPSGQNGHRASAYAQHREEMARAVIDWLR